MKVCCLISDANAAQETSAPGTADSALDAWSRALDAEWLAPEALRARVALGPGFDVVLMEVSAGMRQSIRALAEWLGRESSCLLVAHVSHSLPSAAAELEPLREALSSVHLVIAPQAGICRDIRLKLGISARVLSPPQPLANVTLEGSALRAPGFRPLFSVLGPAGYSRFAFVRDVGLLPYLWAALRFRVRFSNAAAHLTQLAPRLRGSTLVYLASAREDGGALAALCASSGAILLAPLEYDPARLTFPYTALPSSKSASGKRRRSSVLLWLLSSPEFAEFFRETAQKRLALLGDENCRVQFFRCIQYLAPELEYSPQPHARPSLWEQIRHRSGPRPTTAATGSCVLVCLVRNGREHLASFLRHYRALGVREFVFVDNGSDDGTLELLEQDAQVTLYETALPHKDFETQIRRLVIEAHCRKRWCLNVDVDELFDFPLSDQLDLPDLLGYLQQRGATAMVAHMLDMYSSKQPQNAGRDLDLREAYPEYDVSGLERAEYHAHEQLSYCDANVLHAEIPCFSGGIRQRVFGSKAGARYLLIKHPLIFLDGELEPVTHPHYSNHATIADVTGVLYHYKFTPAFKAKALESQASERYVKFAHQQYEQYLTKLGGQPSLVITTPDTRRLNNVDELLELGFVRVSTQYREFAAQHAVRSQAALGNLGDASERRLQKSQDGATKRAG